MRLPFWGPYMRDPSILGPYEVPLFLETPKLVAIIGMCVPNIRVCSLCAALNSLSLIVKELKIDQPNVGASKTEGP